MKKTPASLAMTLVLLAAAPLALAKLPPPPAPTPEVKAKAAETAAKTAWSGKVDAFKMCKSQDRAVEKYRASASAAGKQVPPAVATPPCADPGPFAYVPPPEASKPLEAAGAHSPSTPATSPHNSAQPAAAAPKQQ